MQWLINTSFLKIIRRGIWLCKLTYPVIYSVTLNKSDLNQANGIVDIYAMTFNLRNKDNYLWNAIINVLSANFSQVVRLKLNADIKWTVKHTQKERHERNKTA